MRNIKRYWSWHKPSSTEKLIYKCGIYNIFDVEENFTLIKL